MLCFLFWIIILSDINIFGFLSRKDEEAGGGMVGRDKEGGRVKPGGGGDDMERGSGLIYGRWLG